MNRQIVKSYIEEYKRNFEQVHDQEIYKWKAIKQFRDSFDIDAPNFYDNLELSLSKTGNLLDSGQYFPKRMLLKNVKESPERIREMFKFLYDEDFGILERVEIFRSDFKSLNTINFVDLNDYQDHRAVLVYLTLYYPERYFFYKYRMFKDFADKIDFAYKPLGGRIENIGQFHNLCELVRYEIEGDQELLTLHENRLDSNCYRDIDHNVLTQDFIYAVVRHLNKPTTITKPEVKTSVVEETSILNLISKSESVDFTPRIINHTQNNIENKRIGDLGERWALKKEIEFLTENGKSKLANMVKHIAKELGDGAGYDILSFDLDGNEKYIEVKTTRGSFNSTIYITRNELEWSKVVKDKYFMYRVYNYNENNETANLLKIQGELTSICDNPVTYKVNFEE